jgi:hypothetical protein
MVSNHGDNAIDAVNAARFSVLPKGFQAGFRKPTNSTAAVVIHCAI